MGSVGDISTLDDHNYILRIEKSLLSSLELVFMTDLALELECSKDVVDSFLEDNPNLLSGYLLLEDQIAVVAKISRIGTKVFLSEEGTKEEMKIGKGRCLDLLYTGRRFVFD